MPPLPSSPSSRLAPHFWRSMPRPPPSAAQLPVPLLHPCPAATSEAPASTPHPYLHQHPAQLELRWLHPQPQERQQEPALASEQEQPPPALHPQQQELDLHPLLPPRPFVLPALPPSKSAKPSPTRDPHWDLRRTHRNHHHRRLRLRPHLLHLAAPLARTAAHQTATSLQTEPPQHGNYHWRWRSAAASEASHCSGPLRQN
mmetsp:Transcript_26740/g.58986  ORF Transcript_26740/g.58986 Transcript_26740/m.58986 type:complete len:201 (+) Transcript_26740:332-934(+)